MNFDAIIDRRNTGSVKHDLVAKKGLPADTLPMWVADMDFQTPACVREAIGKAAEFGLFGYSFPDDGYLSAVQSWFTRRFSYPVDKSWIVCTPGIVTALNLAVQVCTQPGDGVLVQTPVYYPFYSVIRSNDRKVVETPLRYENGCYSIDFADMEEKLKTVKLFILCSPHNPICRVWTREELETMGRLCQKYGVTVVSDEIHCDFTWQDHPHTLFHMACPELLEQSIVCTAPSKSFNLAGLQTSNLFIPSHSLRQAYLALMDKRSIHQPNLLGLIACRAAYEGGEAWLEECKTYIQENLAYLKAYLEKNLPKVKLVAPEGTYFAWLDCTGLGLSAQELNRRILEVGRLWLDEGGLFGSQAELFQRIVLATPKANVEETCKRLSQALAD